MRTIIILIALLLSAKLQAQRLNYEHDKFCKQLWKVFESGRIENFESITGTNAKQSPFLQVPGYNIHLPGYSIIYVDKDSRFVAKNNRSIDSLTAAQQIDSLKNYVNACLDTFWKWQPVAEWDDPQTAFFTEVRYYRAYSKELELTLAMVRVSTTAFSNHILVKRRK